MPLWVYLKDECIRHSGFDVPPRIGDEDLNICHISSLVSGLVQGLTPSKDPVLKIEKKENAIKHKAVELGPDFYTSSVVTSAGREHLRVSSILLGFFL